MTSPEGVQSRRSLRLLLRPAAGAALLVVLAGCSVSTGPDSLSGPEIAKLANAELTKSNPDMVEGELTCKKVAYEVDATSRCLRTADVGNGQIVQIGATVKITSVDDGGKFNIVVDDEPQEFGLSGESIAADLATQYADQQGIEPDAVDCPYLLGEVGTKVVCTMALPEEELKVEVEATAVDQTEFNTDYDFRVLTD